MRFQYAICNLKYKTNVNVFAQIDKKKYAEEYEDLLLSKLFL